MATKLEKLPVLAAKGVFGAYSTEDPNTTILIVLTATAEKRRIIPCIKTPKMTYAFLGAASEDFAFDAELETLVNEIFSSKVYKTLPAFKPSHLAAPEHNHVIKDFIKGTGCNENAEARKFLESNGYTIATKELKSSFKKKDYSEVMKDPENQRVFEQDAAYLKKIGATYETLSLETKVAYETVESGSSSGIIFTGATGTGKSVITRTLANHARTRLYNIQITYGTTVEDLVGMFIPNADSPDLSTARAHIHVLYSNLSKLKKDKDESAEAFTSRFLDEQEKVNAKVHDIIESTGGSAKWTFVPGPLLIAKSQGYPIVIEEINFGQPGVIAKINEYTDDTLRVVANGITYEANPNFVCYMTMNPGYKGTEALNIALKNRFAIVDVPELTKAEYCRRLQNYSRNLGHELSSDFFSKLYDFNSAVEKEGGTSKWHEDIKFSIRNATRLCDGILLKKRSFEEFFALMAVQVINNLSIDNDNSAKLQAYKNDKDIKEQVRAIYNLYDFAEAKTVTCDLSWEDLFVEDTGETEDHKAKKDAMVDELFSKFKYIVVK